MLNEVRLGASVGGAGGGRRAGGILVEVISINEIGSSAFNLMNVMNAREERGVVALPPGDADHDPGGQQVIGDGDDDDDDEGPIQRYPRGMLKLQLSDGHTTIQAIEYRSISELELGVTPLGFKVRSCPGKIKFDLTPCQYTANP